MEEITVLVKIICDYVQQFSQFFFYLEVFALAKKMNDFDHKFEGQKV